MWFNGGVEQRSVGVVFLELDGLFQVLAGTVYELFQFGVLGVSHRIGTEK